MLFVAGVSPMFHMPDRMPRPLREEHVNGHLTRVSISTVSCDKRLGFERTEAHQKGKRSMNS
jgi:hypothetical protein